MQCLMCGREITNPNANYCDYCGTAVGTMEYRQEQPVSRQAEEKKPERVSTWLFLGIMCLPFVPFVGTGVAFGVYDFNGSDGAGGFVIAAPRAAVGFNVKFTDLIGLDIYYQYQMMIGNGFGWNTQQSGTNDISNIMATFRVDF